ncbi:hypothetical protein C497_09178 [Halalkalicoccus jeotgali B3]|uniref:Uncharacterized protein n=1 Tax=Halalkalicoccus jeotgali (strain DSM 18796 / CECT 7217 / JCM 14584 / KCTC 4019 / B3) TaxID=795797 RepID=D8J8C7_HALJB|nr:hypothetical protein HacjB3_13960 [Halalkalicoccus jeotgali B3]ELY37601.1 hypothetical protein C497_09178 [Halalkalicoccus jeotgali B3]
MNDTTESTKRILLVTTAAVVAGGSMVAMLLSGDGNIWIALSAFGFLLIAAIGFVQVIYRHLLA